MTSTFASIKAPGNEHKSLLIVLLVLALVYFPFANKAFTVDDTLFLKAAEQVLVNPLDFYAGEVNWYGRPSTQYIVNKNPPLVSYLIAGVASVFGFNEVALHAFFFLVLAISVVGIYQLARQFDSDPLLTTVLATFSPVFLVHGTNVMTDSTLLMFWIWGLVFWMNGIRSGASKWFFLAGLSVTFGILTKYSGAFLLPLMIFSGLWQYRKPGWWLVAVLIPLAATLAFEYYTQALYGKGLFFEAYIYANKESPKGLAEYFDSTMIGLAFLGGCFPVALLLGPMSGGRFLRIYAALFAVAVLALVLFQKSIGGHSFADEQGVNAGLVFQFCIFSLAGFYLVLICIRNVESGFDHDSVFLLLWFFGIFVFASFLNWTINARSFILLVPAAGILLSRGLEHWGIASGTFRKTISRAMIGLAGLVAVAVTYADYSWANIARTAAAEITSKYPSPGRTFFQGHWGFQYYMEKAGALPVDFNSHDFNAGEIVVVPMNNTAILRPNPVFEVIGREDFPHDFFVATMSPARTAGFYSSLVGPLPYVFERPRDETYLIYRMR